MKVNLICSGIIEKTVKNVLQEKGFTLDENAEIIFIQKGLSIPEHGALYIVFEEEDLSKLLIFLDNINLKSIGIDGIIGKTSNDFMLITYDNIVWRVL